MPLFRCDKCGCVENTACGHYWSEKYEEKPVLCSECSDGVWHGKFPKRSAEGMIIDQDGFLWTKEETMPKHYKAVGIVGANAELRAAESGPSQVPG